MYFLGVSYCRSSAGKRAGANRAGWTQGDDPKHPVVDAEAVARQQAYLRQMRPVWRWLLDHADVTLAVDPESPDTSIWAWMITSGPEVLHAIGCKRSIIDVGLCRDIVHDLLGERWNAFQVLTLELPQMRAARLGWKPPKDWFGFDRPTRWVIDPAWVASHMAEAA